MKLNNIKILIIENAFNKTNNTERALENHFETKTLTSGYDALLTVEKNRYDAIVIDINLGDEKMDGLRTMHLIKQNPKYKRVKVFAMSTFPEAREWYIKQGFDDLLLKSMDSEKTVKVIKDKLIPYIIKGKSLLMGAN